MPADAPLKIRLRDFLLPQKLLEQTGAYDNPLLIYSLRRRRRPWRRLVRHALEAVLLVYGLTLLLDDKPDLSRQILFSWPFAFILLRYHLFLSDHSHHIKVLRGGRLQQLLLTPLQGQDYFLHHYLFFCHRYQVVYGLLGIILLGMAWSILSPGGSGIVALFPGLIRLFTIVTFTWVAGVAQYVLSWRMLAGGRRSVLPGLGAAAGSLGLSLACNVGGNGLVAYMHSGHGSAPICFQHLLSLALRRVLWISVCRDHQSVKPMDLRDFLIRPRTDATDE
jgi:hypothetical protein